ncbi:hypothetical protein WR43_16865 [Mycolicibacter arupensis]|uniref:Integral membrane bound transporter domain-containing protein n=2 Tax=Mycolicibacter arupensis TaxID=342002 RepID=A0A0F5MTC7_9MYCO|nr:hypothetical protein WR43_16865 [Mycolicibacter arupensis]
MVMIRSAFRTCCGLFRKRSELLGTVVWPSTQTALAAGFAWYLARDALGHPAPFFAPIAAAVCMWATNVVRAELAVEMMVGVGLGIGLGSGAHRFLGAGPLAMAVVVLASLCAALLIGRRFVIQRPMFVNQTVISAILVLAFPHGGVGAERLFDALIGGGIAVIFSVVLFPKNPLTVLRTAVIEVLATSRDLLTQLDHRSGDTDWLQAVAAQQYHRMARLSEARRTAEQVAQLCPLRWHLRGATRDADRQAAQLSLLAGSVLHLAHVVAGARQPVTESTRAAIDELAAAVSALTVGGPAPAAAHAQAARDHLVPTMPGDAALQDAALHTCIDELDRAIGLATPPRAG